ncbi:MAG: SufD family Fe-S cluster assembly protein [Erysipelotrichaceae bacterium]|nr:SufD family Fe-S cluster assembly protein [Erysipelotrichaceae bacterium]
MSDIQKYQLDKELFLTFENDISVNVVEVDDDAKLKVEVKKGHHFLFINQINHDDIEYYDDIRIYDGAKLDLIYIGLSKGSIKQDSKLTLHQNTEVNLNSSYVATNKKDIKLYCLNQEYNSHLNMDNSCVIKSDGNFSIDAIGKIIKGAKNSSHFQKTRCLTIGNVNNAFAKPSLLIDENDVKAGHALALGTIDKEQLFYLQSRGLSYDASIKLLYESYLKLDLNFLPDDHDREVIGNLFKKGMVNL